MQVFGDSITYGAGASPISKSWVNSSVPTNNGSSGAQAGDLSNSIINAASDNATIMIGTNDVCVYKDNPAKQQHFAEFLRHCVAWASFPNKLFAKDMAMTGTWINTAVNSFGKNTTQQGATISGQVTGSNIFVGYIIQNHQVALSAGDVYVDNELVGSLSCDGMTDSMNTQNGATYANACKVFKVDYGTHDVRIVCTTSGKQMYINYICTDQPENKIKVSNIIKMSTAGYALYGVSEETTDAYNAIIESVLSDFSARLIDNHSSINPLLHLADNLHPNNAGHRVIYNNFST